VRAAVCEGLSELGIDLDPGRNAAARGESVLSPEGARVTILLVPADEERIVARAVAQVVGADPEDARS
jgi:acetate kinase